MRYLSLVSLFLIQAVFADRLWLQGTFEEPRKTIFNAVSPHIHRHEGVSAEWGKAPLLFTVTLSKDLIPSPSIVERATRCIQKEWNTNPDFRTVWGLGKTLAFRKREGVDLTQDEFLVKATAQWFGADALEALAFEPRNSLIALSSLVNKGPLLLPEPFQVDPQNPYVFPLTLKSLRLFYTNGSDQTKVLFSIGEK